MNQTLHIVSAVLSGIILIIFNVRSYKKSGGKSQINPIGIILQASVWGSFLGGLIYVALEKIFPA